MKVEYLRYFLAAASEGSFSEAGSKMHISPSSIGYAIDKLEEQLNTNLFVRIPSKGLSLTPDGTILQEHAIKILDDMESIENNFSSSKNVRGELVVGCQEVLMWSLVPRAIRVIGERYPELKISMVLTDLGKDFALLDQGKIDVLLTFTLDMLDTNSYDIHHLVRPHLFAMMRENHPLDNEKESVSLEELAKYPQVMNNEQTSFDLVKDIYNKYGLSPEIGFTSNLSSGAQSIVGASDCIAARFSRPASNLSPLGDKLVYKKIKEKTERPNIIAAKIKTRLANKRTKREAFIEVCHELFNNGQMSEHFYY